MEEGPKAAMASNDLRDAIVETGLEAAATAVPMSQDLAKDQLHCADVAMDMRSDGSTEQEEEEEPEEENHACQRKLRREISLRVRASSLSSAEMESGTKTPLAALKTPLAAAQKSDGFNLKVSCNVIVGVFIGSVIVAALVATAVVGNGDEDVGGGTWSSVETSRRLGVADLLGVEPEGVCLAAREGELCHAHVTWAMEDGIRLHPQHFPNLSKSSTFEEFQGSVHARFPEICPLPCKCHTAEKGEPCHDRLIRAMAIDIRSNPKLFPGLTTKSRREAFQEALHRMNSTLCPMPCVPQGHLSMSGKGVCEYGRVDRSPGHAGCIVVRKGRLLAVVDVNSYDLPNGRSDGHEPARCTAHRGTLDSSGFRVAPRDLLATVRDGVRLYRCELVQVAPVKHGNGTVWLSPDDVRQKLSEGRWRHPDAARYAEWIEKR